MKNFTKKTVLALRVASIVTVINIFFTVTAIAVITPLAVLGVTVKTVTFWLMALAIWTFPAYIIAMDWIYVFGSWFLIKGHLDHQANHLIDRMERLLKDDSGFSLQEVRYLAFWYKELVTRIKKFDRLSKDLVSPYRQLLSYIAGFIVFASHQQDNQLFTIGMDSIMTTLWVVSLLFLSSACSLSHRRKKMYFLANRLFVKAMKQQSMVSLGHLIILRQMVKSLGNSLRPTICLTDKSGEEFEPMEFVEYVAGTFAQFTLAAKLYHNYFHK